MFYKEEEIIEELHCPKCRRRFSDPRIIPCGQTYCQMCIRDLVEAYEDKKRDTFKCPSCASKHPIPPETGFPPNLVAVRLLKKSSNEVYRSKNVERLKDVLNRIQHDILEFEKNRTK